MNNKTKQDVLDEICRTAKENGGEPLGIARFERETGIKEHVWGKYWARFGDAQKEAGFKPNQLQGAYSEGFLIEKIISLFRKLGRLPTYREIHVERRNDPDLPSNKVFYRLGTGRKRATKIIEYCQNKNGYEDIVELCQSVLKKTDERENEDINDIKIGEVYLFKSGRYYKIGMTNDTVRRGTELRVQLPQKVNLIHSIKTDDPSGVETYWHRRFESKKTETKSEWFDLSNTDVKAFKRWRRII